MNPRWLGTRLLFPFLIGHSSFRFCPPSLSLTRYDLGRTSIHVVQGHLTPDVFILVSVSSLRVGQRGIQRTLAYTRTGDDRREIFLTYASDKVKLFFDL